ncbi:flagellar biosynthesis anti-sigma factor FlgM [Acidihalobacter aeolianus]|uniref:Negative regulator of flagellin synthesis n=1 Tax=Acidihalobacter aeolianus TaxID=2792603 RepID=A0A1D8K6U4_9GAMM|nr:flagellar biosynthesis anti-sigma factor FlgM [Acidihalobacter aeolianus]AOV16656.1 flagellar biosynthesis anti-sigma factor FlgM [Acidihalobacter aeolianus]
MNIDLKNVSSQGGTKTVGDTQTANRVTPQAAEQQGAATTQGTPATSDSVSLTSGGQQLAQLQAGLAQQPVVDKQRVAQLRQSIQNGQYSIDPQRIASKLLGLEGLTKN